MRWLLVIDPRIECGKCSERLRNNPGDKPMCMTEHGCPVGQELASNYHVNKICNAFIKAKRFDDLEGYAHHRNAILEKNGITDPELIYSLEQVWVEYLNDYRTRAARNGK